MANISLNDEIVFNADMEALTASTPAHADVFNARFKQCLENEVFLNNKNVKENTIKVITLPLSDWIELYADSEGNEVKQNDIPDSADMGLYVSTGKYVQEVVDDEITDNNPTCVSMLSAEATSAEQKAYMKDYGIISSGVAVTESGKITFTVWKLPSADISIGLKGV